MNNIPYGRHDISQEDIDAVVQVLRSDFLTQGPSVAEFEKQFAAYIGCEYAVAVSNGTAALHLCALALGVKEGDKVITTPLTFAASANCIRYCGGEVLFADIDPDTLLLDIQQVKKILTAHPKGSIKGMIPVDFAGSPVNLEEYRKLADEYGMWIIEDACHAPGGYFTDTKKIKQHCGNGVYGELAIFSFHPVKHIATGEGGMITTNNEALYKKLLLLRTHGITKDAALLIENHGGWYYEMQELGYNYRLSDMQAALGISQLKRADEGLEKRKEIAQRYEAAFSGMDKITIRPFMQQHAYHLYIIEVEDRLGLYNYLKSKNIFAQVHYIPVHTMPYYKELGYHTGDLPQVENYYKHCLSIPMYPSLQQEEQEHVIHAIKEFLSE
ncbi:MAG TPA: UDP-4-amino-4,6-dideoxy-N-acetyl-beta-L-altrosamine transaminase [Cytophagaceae bacterium]|jgi:UDP-4-amino-4,6-dideoxy-N-acetyl-beta-L-altrosamine transaminase|nr:UDP-4-amino-4,6-dideoxy-N-acetyl-beta-L-altrosamine transaminase [Cytophagaceae bacterium]